MNLLPWWSIFFLDIILPPWWSFFFLYIILQPWWSVFFLGVILLLWWSIFVLDILLIYFVFCRIFKYVIDIFTGMNTYPLGVQYNVNRKLTWWSCLCNLHGIWTASSYFYKNSIINASGVTAYCWDQVTEMFCMKLCLIQKQNGGTSLRRELNRARSCARLFNKPVFFFVTKARVLETYILFLHWIAFCGKETQSNFRTQVHLPSKDESYHNRWFCYCFLFVRKKTWFLYAYVLIGKTVWMQRSTQHVQHVNKTDWSLLPEL